MDGTDPLAVAIAVGAPTLVKFSVDVVRGMRVVPSRWLPAVGVVLGLLYVALMAIVAGRAFTTATVAAVALGGVAAFLIAAGLTDTHTEARPRRP